MVRDVPRGHLIYESSVEPFVMHWNLGSSVEPLVIHWDFESSVEPFVGHWNLESSVDSISGPVVDPGHLEHFRTCGRPRGFATFPDLW